MNVLIQIVHPAHFYYYRDTIANLKRDGHKVIVAIVTKDVLEDVVRQSGVEYVNICPKSHKKHGKIGVAYDMAMRDLRMLWLALRHSVDIITGSTIETAHIGWLLRKPNINIGEDDAAVVMKYIKQIKPFVGVRLTPDCCDNGPIEPKSIHFPGYYKTAYLRPGYFTADASVPEKYGIDVKKPYFLIRFSALNAFHDVGISGISNESALRLVEILKPHGTIYISSERELDARLEPYRLKINPIDMHHIMAFASLYIGDSQTMAAEAGILGVPFVRFNDFVGRIGYLKELEEKYGLGFGVHASELPEDSPIRMMNGTVQPSGVEELYKAVERLVAIGSKERHEVFQARREKMLADRIDTVKFLTWFIEEWPKSGEEMKAAPKDAESEFWSKFK